MTQQQAALQAKEAIVFNVECFGFRGRGGFRITASFPMNRDMLLDNLYANKEYQQQYSHPHHHWAEKAPIPARIEAGSYEFGYRLTDDPYEHGGSGSGEYYFSR